MWPSKIPPASTVRTFSSESGKAVSAFFVLDIELPDVARVSWPLAFPLG
jgi:hypothetical protein